ncbi:single hybrid motif-containing protein [Dunaliella salina]|uniref:Dihydrolipoamide acetyltransferase component of pyruvate dehydrogenase complex n=1 Tax=Dunaliella salina TaxID=3046 RepID=A0ABQ7FX47_DUNSA|nr:single hybrid motif-containing protein [Dunaliella salina]|eukprot:KAF5826934.1 single hybrid motif-containing protein [Dunaliella salina]
MVLRGQAQRGLWSTLHRLACQARTFHAPPCCVVSQSAPVNLGAQHRGTRALAEFKLQSQPQGIGFLQQRFFSSFPPHQVMGMPALSPTMTQGNISRWLKKEGEEVGPGMLLAEVETDKATMEWEAQEEGYVAKILKPDGAKDVAVGEPVYVLVEEQSLVPAFKDFQVGGAPSAAAPTEEPSAPPTPPPTPPPQAPKPAAPKAKKYPDHQVLGMPALSPTMSQGNIVEWMKKPGDRVEAGEVFCEVETDKATVAWESTEEGYLAQILLPAGSKDIPINTPAMVVVEDQSAVEAFKDFTAADAAAEAEGGAPAVAAPAAEEAPAAEPSTTPEPPVTPAAPAAEPARAGERVVASPYARKLAAEAGLSLEGLAGSGPEGRIVAEDVHKAVAAGKAGAKPAAPAAPTATKAAPAPPPPAPGATFTDIPHNNIRRVTARRLLEAKNTVPHYYVSMEVTMDEMLRVREQLNAANKDTGAKISVNDFVIKAAALALKKVGAAEGMGEASGLMFRKQACLVSLKEPCSC